MKLLISGSTGLVGSTLVQAVAANKDDVYRLVRKKNDSSEKTVLWNPSDGQLNPADIEGFDAVIHLAGESIAAGRWTDQQKAKIRDSRVNGTTLLSKTLASLKQPPKVLVSASAIGIYGDRGDELLNENSKPGTGFLVDVCREWEAAAEPAEQRGIRTVKLRFGMILSPTGGALGKMLTPFRMGVGGIIGSGNQYISWITIDDVVGIIQESLKNDSLKGPVNTVTPNPVTNREFTKTLGKVLGRLTIFPVPSFGARLAFGQMADELLLASQRVEPARLKSAGYQFRFPNLEGALRHVLNK
ncbi:MAG TPA: TIGR01777 family oxidoreductase [Blastocatellia bacterium]|nr:TIGR01777 family oxidoreductase [Blastocatellia bacterium]